MEYTVRLAFKRDGEIVAPPRVTFSSHDTPAEVRAVYRDAVNAALARRAPSYLLSTLRVCLIRVPFRDVGPRPGFA